MRDRRAFFVVLLGAGALAAHSAESDLASGAGTPVETIRPAPDDCGDARTVASADADAGSRAETRTAAAGVGRDGSAGVERTVADECGIDSESGDTDRRTGGGSAAPGR